MVKKVEGEDEAMLYQNYTIQMLHAPRDNEKATDLYQMLRINEPTLDSRCKILDVLCFPEVCTTQEKLPYIILTMLKL